MRCKVIATMISGIALSAYSQYFGTPVYTEGFDMDSSIEVWTQTDESPGEKTKWTVEEKKGDPFSAIDPASKKSAMLNIASRDTKLTLISPEIDLAGKSGLQIGFYGYELSFCLRGNVDFRFSVSADGGASWSDLFNAIGGSSYTGERVGGWNLYKYNLPEEYEGKKVRIRFYVDASTAFGNPGGLPGYIDGVFISELPKVDLAVSSLNFSANSLRPTSKLLGTDETISFTVNNVGVAPVQSMEVYYSVNGGERVVETFAPASALQPGASMVYRFAKRADLSKPRGKFTVTAGVIHTDDAYEGNNETIGYAENIVAGIPYTPDFLNEADLDGWSTDDDGSTYWDYDDWKEFYWFIEPEYSDGDVDAWVVSRPVWLEEDKTYRVNFSAFTEDEGDGVSRLAVLVGDSDDIDDAVEIWRNDDVDDENCLSQGAIFECDETGPRYFFFRCLSDEGAGLLRLENISFTRQVNADVAVLGIDAPKENRSLYSDSEKVIVKIANNGASPVSGSNLELRLYVNDELMQSQRWSGARIEPGNAESASFDKTVDMSVPGKEYRLRVEAVLDGDENPGDNMAEVTVVSRTAGVPYIPDFGDASEKSKEAEYWTVNDNNNDGYSFVNSYDSGLDTRLYSYGGGMIGLAYVTIPQSDEALMSRPVKFEAGGYKVSFRAFVGKAGVAMPLAVKLYKETDGTALFEKTLGELNIDNSGNGEFVIPAEVAVAGIYRVSFEVKTENEIDYRIYLSDFRISGDLECDLSVEDIIIPTARVSSVDEFPIGAVIRNNGSGKVSSFTLTAEKNGDEVMSRRFDNIGLEPDSSYEVYFSDMYGFGSAADSEMLVVRVGAVGDEYAGNDSKSLVLSRREAESVPYSPEAHLAMDEWGAYNYNFDISRFRRNRVLGNGYMYESDGAAEANDVLASPGIELDEDVTYALSFSYYVNEGDSTDFTVSAFDKAGDTTVSIVEYHNATQSALTQSTQYFTVPESGVYNICFNPEGNAKSLFVSASIRVVESEDNPDLQVSDIIVAEDEGVFGESETVQVELCNLGDVAVQGVPVSLTVGDKVYHEIYTRWFSPDDDNVIVTFSNVDLSAPGEYELVAKAHVGADDYPRDNVLAKKVKSLPVVDVAVTRLIKPVSGDLSAIEPVTVEVRNLGKGTLTNVEMKCVITCDDDDSEVTLEGVLGSLADNAVSEYTFDQRVDFSDRGVYTLEITAVAEGDADLTNNGVTARINSTHQKLDVGVIGIVEPADGVLTDSEHISVRVGNFCDAPLFDVPVQVIVKDPENHIAAIMMGKVASLPAEGEAVYTFDDTVDMSKPGVYAVEATTTLDSDSNRDNNKATASVKCFTRDLGVTAILSPESGENLGECEVTIEITNFGEAAVKDFPVSYQIGAMPQLATVHEEIAPGGKLIYTFPVKYEFVAYRNYTITSSTLLEDDYDTSNDLLTKEIENRVGGVDETTAVNVTVSPNPTKGMVTVKAGFVMEQIFVYDIAGRMVFHAGDIDSDQVALTLGVPAGNYVMIVRGNAAGEIRTIRLIVS